MTKAPLSRWERKVLIFKRDGWLGWDSDSRKTQWKAYCAFGCGAVLTLETATVDRYPIPGHQGGTYHLDNTRAACLDCNEADGQAHSREVSILKDMSHKQRQIFRRAQRQGIWPVITPNDIFGPDYVPEGDIRKSAGRPGRIAPRRETW